MRCLLKGLLFVAAAAIMCGCSKAIPSKAAPQKPAAFSELPVEMMVKQRSTTNVSGSKLRLTIDDITRGQVMVSLADADGVAVLAATSLKSGESASFTLDGDEYQLRLRELDNELIGDDFATFVISTGSASAPGATPSKPASSAADRSGEGEKQANGPISEHEKIERLLDAIENDVGLTFIRNNAEHSAKEAAEHLRAKWEAAGDQIKTIDDFIDQVASKSSLTGEPYRVRRADGTVVSAGDYLREKLQTIAEERPASE